MSVVWGKEVGEGRSAVQYARCPFILKTHSTALLQELVGQHICGRGWLATTSHIKNIVNGMEDDSRWVPWFMTLRVADIFRTVTLPHHHPTTTNSGRVHWSSAANVMRPNFYRKTSKKRTITLDIPWPWWWLFTFETSLFIIFLFINFWDLVTQFLQFENPFSGLQSHSWQAQVASSWNQCNAMATYLLFYNNYKTGINMTLGKFKFNIYIGLTPMLDNPTF